MRLDVRAAVAALAGCAHPHLTNVAFAPDRVEDPCVEHLLATATRPEALAVSDGTVVFIDAGEDRVRRIAADGADTVLLRDVGEVRDLDARAGVVAVAAVDRVVLLREGAVPITFEAASPTAVALADGAAWWTSADGALSRAPLEGGTPSVVARGLGTPVDLAVDARDVVVTDRRGSGVVAVSRADASARSLPVAAVGLVLEGGNVWVIGEGPAGPEAVALDRDRGTTRPADGGSVVVPWRPHVPRPPEAGRPFGAPATGRIALARDRVYWTEGERLLTKRWPIGLPEVLADRRGRIAGVATSGRVVYWTEADRGRVVACEWVE